MSKYTYSFVHKYLELNGYAFSRNEVNIKLKSHTGFPQLTAIADTLDMLGVASIMAEVPKEFFSQLPDEFISVLFPEPGNTQLVMVDKSSAKIRVHYGDNSSRLMSESDFLKQWSEVLLSVDENEVISANVSPLNKIINRPLPIAGSLGVLSLFIFLISRSTAINSYLLAYTSLSITGIIISILLVKETMGFNLGQVARICHLSSKTNCSRILHSGGAKIFKDIFLSDICLVYFTSIFTLSLFLIRFQLYETLYLISLLTLLPSIYSIYYQAIVLRNWCTLCLGVLLIFVLQFLSLHLSGITSTLSISAGSFTFFIFTLFSVFWLILKPSIQTSRMLGFSLIQFHMFKRNQGLFRYKLRQQAKADTATLKKENLILLGSSEAPIPLYGIISPACNMCYRSYQHYQELINRHPETYNVSIIFNLDSEDHAKNDQYMPLINRLMELNQDPDRRLITDALNDWYIQRPGLAKWTKKWGKGKERFTDNIAENRQWCSANGIEYTPETIVHNTLLPGGYDVSDLAYFKDSLLAITKAELTRDNI